MQVNVLDAKNRLSELIRRVRDGETVMIANRGVAVAHLTPVAPACGAAVVGSGQALLDVLDRPRPDWMARAPEDVDAEIAEARAAWD